THLYMPPAAAAVPGPQTRPRTAIALANPEADNRSPLSFTISLFPFPVIRATSRSGAILLAIRDHFAPLLRQVLARRQQSQQVVERRDRDDRDADFLFQLLHRGTLAAAAFHPVEGDQHASRGRAVGPDQLDRLALGPAVGNDVVDDQDPAFERSPDDRAALAVILGFLAIETVRQIVTFCGEGDSRHRGQRYAFVGRAVQLIATYLRGQIRRGVVPTQLAQTRSVVEQTRVEEIRCLAARLGDERTKSKHVACQRKLEKVLAEIGHEKGVARRGVRPQIIPRALGAGPDAARPHARVNFRAAAARPPPQSICASSHSTSTASAQRSARVWCAGCRASSPGTSYACRRSRLIPRTCPRLCGRRANRTPPSITRRKKATAASPCTPGARCR